MGIANKILLSAIKLISSAVFEIIPVVLNVILKLYELFNI